MKFVVAIIKPFKLDEVRQALDVIGVVAMTVSDVGGIGRQKGQTEIYRGAEYDSNPSPKVRIEIATPDNLVGGIVETIRMIANTDDIGDGKIFVFELGAATRIRTGEIGEPAL